MIAVVKAGVALGGALAAWILVGEQASPGVLQIAEATIVLGVAGWFGYDGGAS